MMALAEEIARRSHVTRDTVRQQKAKVKPGRPKSFVFRFRPPDKTFRLNLTFKKSRVERDDVIKALEAILAKLREGGHGGE